MASQKEFFCYASTICGNITLTNTYKLINKEVNEVFANAFSKCIHESLMFI